jgi:hypothetical protein
MKKVVREETRATLIDLLQRKADVDGEETGDRSVKPRQCVVCTDRIASHVMNECGHICLCDQDALKYLERGIPNCPMCRKPGRPLRLYP